MDINSLSGAFYGSFGAYNQKLTQKTKEKLDKLGIIYDAKISEAQGKSLLKAHQQGNLKENVFDFNQNSKNSYGDELFKRALELAKKLGVEANENNDIKSVLSLIEQELKKRAQERNLDIDSIKELKRFSDEFELLNIQANGANTMNFNLMDSLDIMGKYNKNFLNY